MWRVGATHRCERAGRGRARRWWCRCGGDQGAFGGPPNESSKTGVLHDLNWLFSLPTGRLCLYGAAIAAYALINSIEAIGLWSAR